MRWAAIIVLAAAVLLTARVLRRPGSEEPEPSWERSVPSDAEPLRLEGREEETAGAPPAPAAAPVARAPLTLRGTVRLRGLDEPATDGTLAFYGRGGSVGAGVVRPDGTFEATLGALPTSVAVNPGPSRTFLPTRIPLRQPTAAEPLRLEVSPGVVLAGRVSEAGTGAGIAEAEVRVLEASVTSLDTYDPRATHPAATTGADGSFRVTGIAPDPGAPSHRVDLVARKSGWRSASVTVEMVPGSGSLGGIRIVLDRGLTWRGRVEGGDGTVPSGLPVYLVRTPRPALDWAERIEVVGRGVVGDDGGFEIAVLESEVGTELHVPADRTGEPALRLSGLGPQGREDLLVTLPAREPLVVTPGYPPGVSGKDRPVVVLWRRAESDPWRSGPPARREGDGSLAIRAFAGRVGMERPDLLFRGEARLGAAGGSLAGEATVPLQEVGAPVLPFDWWDVEGDPTPGVPSALLLLTFVDAETGAPLASTTVVVEARRTRRRCRLGEDGRYVLPAALGEHWLTFVAPGYVPETVRLAPGEPSLVEGTLRLRKVPR